MNEQMPKESIENDIDKDIIECLSRETEGPQEVDLTVPKVVVPGTNPRPNDIRKNHNEPPSKLPTEPLETD